MGEEALSDYDKRAIFSKERRDRLRAKGVCINGESHGPATHGVLCEKCRIVHRGSNKNTRVEQDRRAAAYQPEEVVGEG